MRYFFLIFGALILMNSSDAQDFSGTYTTNTPSGTIALVLKSNEAGFYSGSLSDNNTVINLTGQVLNGILKGRVGEAGSTLVFAAAIQNQILNFTMAQADAYGNVNAANAQILTFTKSQATIEVKSRAASDVIINSTVLSKDQIRELVKRYGIEPKPGNYWYDPVSGLFGVTGYPSYGFMYPGHNFGSLKRNASSGNTGVILNGRELPQAEWAVFSYVIGYYVQPGSYWMDEKGNVGYQGNRTPVLNLFVLARQNGYTGKGSGGDNFWTSRFSAGNSNADNSQGYVSVPGYGPVGYGF